MILDAFLYNGEQTMLDLRLATLAELDLRHVAVICNLTHQGDPNEVEDPKGCEVLRVDPIPYPGGNEGKFWLGIENQHRDAIAAIAGVAASDVVVVSDVDEIPTPGSIMWASAQVAESVPVCIPMRMHGFALDYLHPAQWHGSTVSRGDQLSPQVHRLWRHGLPKVGKGWHLSWMGSMDERRRKARSFCHNDLSDLDVESCWRDGVHANGEVMHRLTAEEFASLPWPALDKITVPDSWRAPDA